MKKVWLRSTQPTYSLDICPNFFSFFLKIDQPSNRDGGKLAHQESKRLYLWNRMSDLKQGFKFKFFCCLEVYLKNIINMDLEGTLDFFLQDSPKNSLPGFISGSIWGSMKVQEGPLFHITVPGYPKSCYQKMLNLYDAYQACK